MTGFIVVEEGANRRQLLTSFRVLVDGQLGVNSSLKSLYHFLIYIRTIVPWNHLYILT